MKRDDRTKRARKNSARRKKPTKAQWRWRQKRMGWAARRNMARIEKQRREWRERMHGRLDDVTFRKYQTSSTYGKSP